MRYLWIFCVALSLVSSLDASEQSEPQNTEKESLLTKKEHHHPRVFNAGGSEEDEDIQEFFFERRTRQYYNPIKGRTFIGPYLFQKLAFNGSDLIVNAPKIREYITLMYMKQRDDRYLPAPRLAFSGVIEGQAFYTSLNHISNVNLSTVEFDVFCAIAKCASGLLTMEYDDTPFEERRNPINNSRVFIDKAFLMIGNFDCFPFYGVWGQTYMPFGVYSSVMISSPLNQAFRFKERTALLGWERQQRKNITIEAYVAKSAHSPHPKDINLGGAYLQYAHYFPSRGHFIASCSFVNNISDGQGFNLLFTAVDHPISFKQNVPGLDFFFEYNAPRMNFIVEYTTALRAYKTSEMTYYHSPAEDLRLRGAHPKALSTEMSYTFNQCGVSQVLALGFQKSWQMTALALPNTRYLASYILNLWRDTIWTFEFKHDHFDALGGSAGGEPLNDVVRAVLNKHVNTWTTQLDFYF